MRAIIAALRDDPEGLRRDLCHFKTLRSYPPEVGQKVLGSRWEVLRKAKVDTDTLDLVYGGAEARIEIEYLSERLRPEIGGADGIEAMLGQVGDLLEAEFHFIEGLLREHPEWMTPGLLKQIRQRFAPIRTRIGQSLATLRKLIKPAFPIAPQGSWGAAEWLAWVRDSYMPYYAWLEAQNRYEEPVSESATTFADWFYANLVALKTANRIPSRLPRSMTSVI